MKHADTLSVDEIKTDATEKLLSLGPFINRFYLQVSEASKIAGVMIEPTETLDEIVAKTQIWAKGDHYDPQNRLDLTEEEKNQAYRIFEHTGLLKEIAPEGGVYDQILILGGEQNSNHIRLDYVLSLIGNGQVSLGSVGKLVCLGGDRQLKGRELPAVAKDLQVIINNSGNDSWLKKLLHNPMIEGLNEESAMRLAVFARLGQLSLSQAHIRLESSDIFSHREFKGGDIIPNITTIHAPKVDRPLGPKRHTTESTLAEWVRVVEPRVGGRVLFVSNAPYAIRTARNLYSVVHKIRPDLDLDYCAAPASYDNLLIRRCYGELARLLYEDLSQR